MSAFREDEDSEESGGRNIKIPSGGRIMKQSYKIYENLLSAVSVYRTGSTKNSSFYKDCDDASLASSDSDPDQDQDPGTDDSGVDSINSDPQLNISPAQCSDSGLEMRSRLRAETESGVRSFLHTSKQSELWSGALSPQDHLNTSDHNGSSVTLSDDLSELSQLLTTTNTFLQRNTRLRASLTISAVKRSPSTVSAGRQNTPRSPRKSCRLNNSKQDSKMTGGGSPQVRRNTGEGNDVTKQQVCEEEKLKLGSGVRQETEFLSHKSQDFITNTTGTKSLSNPTKPETSGAASFVRVYTDRNGNSSHANSSYRKSMAIRPQTVANLASKFDSIVQEKVPLKKSNSRQLKLRTYDITKIINELNKINTETEKTKELEPEEKTPSNKWPEENIEESDRYCGTTVRAVAGAGTGQTVRPAAETRAEHSDTSDRALPQPSEQRNILSRNDSAGTTRNALDQEAKKLAKLSAGSESGVRSLRATSSRKREDSLLSIMSDVSSSQSLASKYLAAVNSGRASSGGKIKLTNSGCSVTVPSVKQTQKLLLIKTGGLIDDNLCQNSKTEKFSQRKIPTETEEKRNEKCWEQYLTMKLPTTKSQKESNSKVKQTTSTTFPSVNPHTSEDSQPKPNSSFLWNKANRAQPSSCTAAEKGDEELYDDVKNCHTYSDISCYDDIQNVGKNTDRSEELEPVYVSTENLSVNYDDITNITNKTMDTQQAQKSPPTLVTATPAVILEDQCDSLSILYDDIRRDVGDDVTLYESIAGSLLRLDKLQCDEEPPSSEAAGKRQENNTRRGHSVISDRSDEWVDIDSEDDYEERNLTRHVHFMRNSVRASNKRVKFSRMGSARLGQGWNRAVRDVCVTDAGDEMADHNDSIYEVIKPIESESDFEEIQEESDDSPDFTSSSAKVSNSNLSKIAEAAGRKMKKLKTNWSIKKSDITRSLSRIKKTSRPSLDLNNSYDVSAKRKLSRKSSYSQSRPSIRFEEPVESSESDTMFYITLTIEEDGSVGGGGGGGPVTVVAGNSQDSDVDSNTYSQMSTDSGGSRLVSPTLPTTNLFSNSNLSRRVSSKSGHYSVVRPAVPPPAPPVRRPPVQSDTESLSGTSSLASSKNDSLLLCDSLKEFYVGIGETDSGLDSTEAEEAYTSSLFQTEPLYQFYDKEEDCSDKNNNTSVVSLDSTTQDVEVENIYESVSNVLLSPGSVENSHRKAKVSRSSAMDIVISCTGRRSLWAELPEVIGSGILQRISPEEKKLQEAMFEVISSEASYLKSLNILISHFVQSSQFSGDTSVLSKRDQRILFSEVISVRSCSEKFLADLESRWQESVVLSGISDVIMKHANQNFQVYVKYCSNQVYQDRTLKRLRDESPDFVEALKELECQEACQGLAMHSFLMLPMQRITRLPLLTDAIASRLPHSSPELSMTRSALQLLSNLVCQCNESARYMERMEEMLILSQQLDFRDVKAIPLISASRWLVKRGECTRVTWKENGEKLTFGRRVHKQNLALFLFTDVLVVTKKKGEERYLVLDYSSRNMLQITPLDSVEGVPGLGESQQPGYAVWLTLLQNQESRTLEMLLNFSSDWERERWVEALTPVMSEVAGERIYEQWDCPRVRAVSQHRPGGSEELEMVPGDSANVLKKTKDGDEDQSVEIESSRL